MPKWFLYIGRLEGLSFLALLFIAMPFKYMFHWPLLVKIMGPIHGALFLAYCAAVFILGASAEWSIKKHAWALIASILPAGTFVFERQYRDANELSRLDRIV